MQANLTKGYEPRAPTILDKQNGTIKTSISTLKMSTPSSASTTGKTKTSTVASTAPVKSNGSTKPDKVTHSTENEEWLLNDREVLAPISERYEGKGKSIVYLTSELFQRALSDDESMEIQLNSMRQKVNVLKMLGQLLKDSLAAIATVISLPPTYSTLRTILMAADDKLTTDAVVNQVLIEERLRKVYSAHSALAAKTAGRSKQKGKGKVSKEERERLAKRKGKG